MLIDFGLMPYIVLFGFISFFLFGLLIQGEIYLRRLVTKERFIDRIGDNAEESSY